MIVAFVIEPFCRSAPLVPVALIATLERSADPSITPPLRLRARLPPLMVYVPSMSFAPAFILIATLNPVIVSVFAPAVRVAPFASVMPLAFVAAAIVVFPAILSVTPDGIVTLVQPVKSPARLIVAMPGFAVWTSSAFFIVARAWSADEPSLSSLPVELTQISVIAAGSATASAPASFSATAAGGAAWAGELSVSVSAGAAGSTAGSPASASP